MIYKGIEIDEDALYQETVDTILDIMAENQMNILLNLMILKH